MLMLNDTELIKRCQLDKKRIVFLVTDLVWDAVGPPTRRTHAVSTEPRLLLLCFCVAVSKESSDLQQTQ